MQRKNATDLEIKNWVFRRYGFFAESAWIAQCKEHCGLPLHLVPAVPPAAPCPPQIQFAIKQAFLHFGMLPEA